MGSTEPLSLAPVASEIEPVSPVTYAAMSTRTPPPSHEHPARKTRMHNASPALSDCRAPTCLPRQTNQHTNPAPWTRLAITLTLICTLPSLISMPRNQTAQTETRPEYNRACNLQTHYQTTTPVPQTGPRPTHGGHGREGTATHQNRTARRRRPDPNPGGDRNPAHEIHQGRAQP
jgi:hypothetical protein